LRVALSSLDELDHFSRTGSFSPAWDDVDWGRAFVPPEDDVSGALVELVRSAGESLFLACPDLSINSHDGDFGAALVNRLSDDVCYVQLTAGTRPEWITGSWPLSSVAVGEGFTLELMVVDATDVVLLGGGLVVVRDPTFAAFFQARMSQLHSRVLARSTPGGNP
jgi:hypothetical protein